MSEYDRIKSRGIAHEMGFAFLASALLVSFWVSSAEARQRAVIATGEVVANDVYVRSGNSLNHYTICKLSAGQRVSILGERGEWYEILAPPGTFSLVSGEYVDTADGKHGVINGTNVRIRAGSTLNENKYTVQTMLSKGAEVTIVGENADGFLRIEPPRDATVWINRSFVEPVPEDRLALDRWRSAEDTAQTPSGPMNSSPGSLPGDSSSAGGGAMNDRSLGTQGTRSSVSGDANWSQSAYTRDVAGTNGVVVDSGGGIVLPRIKEPPPILPGDVDRPAQSAGRPDWTSQVGEPVESTVQRGTVVGSGAAGTAPAGVAHIDAAMRSELARPGAERNLSPIVEQFRSVATTTEDDVARQYAEARIKQLEHVMSLGEAARRLRELHTQTSTQRRRFIENRTKIPRAPEFSSARYDAQGELRNSFVYSEKTGMKRFRLVDPSSGTGKTIAYIELPDNSTIDISMFIGRLVGVRASSSRLLPGSVDAVPVYLVDDLTVLDSRTGQVAAGS